jgi:hypothetical protein
VLGFDPVLDSNSKRPALHNSARERFVPGQSKVDGKSPVSTPISVMQ